MKWSIELPLAAVLVLLLALWAVPRPAHEPAAGSEAGGGSAAAGAPPDAAGPEEAGAPPRQQPAPEDLRPAEEESRRIAALFGWKAGAARVPASAAGAAPAGPPAAEEPADADWLKPFGFVVGQEGERTYVFKDSRSGNVLSLLPGGESRGWKLLEVGAGGYILEHEGRRYRVK